MKINYPETIVQKSTGTTKAERYLYRLCTDSFLSMWSYSSIYRDEGTRDSNGLKGDGKEVCDLLVVFGDNIIIFSDKDCSFPTGDNLKLNWTRWYRKAILQSADQIFGAEKWLLKQQARIFLDKSCKIKIPVPLPQLEHAKVHRIVVAHGISQHCRKILGGSGSLILDTSIDENIATDLNQCLPFVVGKVNSKKGFVHIFDDTTLEVLMGSLDTITDFVNYLLAKENLLSGSFKVQAAGEEELLATYLSHTNPAGLHIFPSPPSNTSLCVYAEGEWQRLQQKQEYKNQMIANRSSYFWDHLIEKFVNHIFSGTSYHLTSIDIKDHERVFRIMAKEDRTRRRMLSDAFLEMLRFTGSNQRATRTVIPTEIGDPCYVFFILPRQESETLEHYRDLRRELLNHYCLIAKLNTFADTIIGIATEPSSSKERSEDIVFLDASKWTENDQKNARDLEENLKRKGLRAKKTWSTSETYEFPRTPQQESRSPMKGKDRNKKCFCGRNQKFKNCCGKN